MGGKRDGTSLPSAALTHLVPRSALTLPQQPSKSSIAEWSRTLQTVADVVARTSVIDTAGWTSALAPLLKAESGYAVFAAQWASALTPVRETYPAIETFRAALSALPTVDAADLIALRPQLVQLLSAHESVAKSIGGLSLQPNLAILAQTVARYGLLQTEVAGVVARRNDVEILRGYTTLAGLRYDDYLSGLPARPIARRATVARQAGDTQSGLVVAESLTAFDLGPDERAELAQQVTATILEPWQSGPADARNDLFDALASLDAGLPEWLKGAWDDIVRDGPAAASKIANCTVECVDRALRAAAPNDEVMAWLAGRRSGTNMVHNGKPTRPARVHYVMRSRSRRDARLAAVQVEALAALVQAVVDDLQSVKHGEAPAIAVMRGWVLAAEGALSQLFLHS